MAMSPSPQPASLVGVGRRIQRQDSNSPAPQPQILSKKDKKRDQIKSGYLQRMEAFTKDRDSHYRVALQTLQIDINLITEADPHENTTLLNDPEEIDRLVRECIQKNMMKHFSSEPPPQSGRGYSKFAKAVNDAAEERDASLAALERETHVKLFELESECTYRKRLAQTEYKALGSSLRDRLINSVTGKKNRLIRDKEMDIGDSTAMLLHPSQFGLANPASPGGVHNKRTTRRGRDVEEPIPFPETNKRKRKAQENDDSPAPSRPRLDNLNDVTIPREKEWMAERKQLTETQIESALYSVEKLFTEKELTMTYNAAALAAHNYMLRHSPLTNNLDSLRQGNSSSSSDNGKVSTTIEAAPESTDDRPESPAPIGGMMMERQPSHQTRSTRGTTNGNFMSNYGIDALADESGSLSLSNLQLLTRQIPKLPPLLSFSQASRSFAKTESAPPVPGLSAEDTAAEIDAIRKARTYNDVNGLGSNLESDQSAMEMLRMVAESKRRWVPSAHRMNVSSSVKLNGGGSFNGHGASTPQRGRLDGGEPMSRNVSQQ